MFKTETITHVSRLERQEIARSFARLFASEDGQKCLAYLQLTTFHRALPAKASEAELRYAEGQRALVAMITRMAEHGRRR